jgi:hypothetical protein
VGLLLPGEGPSGDCQKSFERSAETPPVMIHDGRLLYDVIDGRQRLDTIFMLSQLGRFGRGLL